MRDRRDQTAIIKEHQQEQNPRGSLETDCGSSGPILEDEAILKIAQCLRKLEEEHSDIAQQEMKAFQPRFHELLNDQTSKVFLKMVTELSNNHVLQIRILQLGPEMNMLKTALILGMYNSKELSELVPSVKTALADCLNRNLLNWIRHSGGWENLL